MNENCFRLPLTKLPRRRLTRCHPISCSCPPFTSESVYADWESRRSVVLGSASMVPVLIPVDSALPFLQVAGCSKTTDCFFSLLEGCPEEDFVEAINISVHSFAEHRRCYSSYGIRWHLLENSPDRQKPQIFKQISFSSFFCKKGIQ